MRLYVTCDRTGRLSGVRHGDRATQPVHGRQRQRAAVRAHRRPRRRRRRRLQRRRAAPSLLAGTDRYLRVFNVDSLNVGTFENIL